MQRETNSLGGFQELKASSPDAELVANPETGAIVEASESAAEFFGYTQDDLCTMEILDIHPADEQERYSKLFEKHFEEQPAIITQFDDGSPVIAVTADGDQIPVEINAWAVADDDGEGALLKGIFRDISGRFQRQRELERQNDRLREFTAVVSHDLRNPLSVAQGRATLLAQECDSGHSDALRTALDRMGEIIEDTLILAQNGNRVGELESVNIVDAIGDCWGSVETPEATIEIVDEFTMQADPNRLKHICENLIRNAIEHGRNDVTVRCGRADADTFYFEDDGKGIPEDKREAVFESGHSSDPEGSGFGLTIVQRLAEAHGWDVTLTESDSGGVRFEFTGVEIE